MNTTIYTQALQCAAAASTASKAGIVVIVGRKGLDELLTKFAGDESALNLFKKCLPTSGCDFVKYIQVDVSQPDCGAVLVRPFMLLSVARLSIARLLP